MKTSASKLKIYKTCPLQYRYTHELGFLQPISEAMLLGLAYHKAIENYYQSNQLPNDDVLKPMIQKYLENPVKGIPVENEKVIKFDFEDISIKAIIDRLDEDKIVEYKTSSFDYKEADVSNWQTDLYIWLIYKTTGKLLPMEYSVLNKKKVKSKKYKPQIIRVERDNIEEIEENLRDVLKHIKYEDFPPNPDSHCYWCPYGRKSGTGNCRYSL